MKIIGIILILAASSMASSFQEQGLSLNQKIKLAEPSKFKKHQLQIERETGLDGKVRSIRLDMNDDIPGVRVYGIPKNKLIDSMKIEKSDPKPVLKGDPRNSRPLVDVHRLKMKDENKDNAFIERVPLVEQQPFNVVKIVKRSIEDVGKSDLELKDLEAAEAKVFRPLFVYRQQVNRRKAEKQKKKGYPKKYDPRVVVKKEPIYRYPRREYFYERL